MKNRKYMVLAFVALVGFSSSSATTAKADTRTDVLLRVLKNSPSFRVRAQAACALSPMKDERDINAALSSCASSDPHPVVKEACAQALQGICL